MLLLVVSVCLERQYLCTMIQSVVELQCLLCKITKTYPFHSYLNKNKQINPTVVNSCSIRTANTWKKGVLNLKKHVSNYLQSLLTILYFKINNLLENCCLETIFTMAIYLQVAFKRQQDFSIFQSLTIILS